MGRTVLRPRKDDPDTAGLMALETSVPPKALVLSLLALGVAALASLVWPQSLEELAALVWLLALIPSFLFAYYRGWEGAAGGLAAAMALLILFEVAPPLISGTRVDWRIAGGITVVFIMTSLGAGSIAELLRRQKVRALEMAYADPLTGLPNRRVLDFFLGHHFASAQRGIKLAVVMFDLDGFKAYNDRFGHQAGDEALQAFAQILRTQARRSDLGGRYGGEEFLAILPHEGLDGARTFAERVRNTLARHELPTGVGITVSGGLACFEPTMSDAHELVQAADDSMYEAKAAGGNRVEPTAQVASDGPSERMGATPA
jgi:diguanylate cyclase (GGDEF)-like protein